MLTSKINSLLMSLTLTRSEKQPLVKNSNHPKMWNTASCDVTEVTGSSFGSNFLCKKLGNAAYNRPSGRIIPQTPCIAGTFDTPGCLFLFLMLS